MRHGKYHPEIQKKENIVTRKNLVEVYENNL